MMGKETALSKKKRKYWYLFFLALPFMLLVILFNYVPLGGWILSLVEYQPGTPLFKNNFVGLKNFIYIFSTPGFSRIARNTLILSALGLLLMVCPVIFAILLNEINNKRFRRVSQTITTLPYFISWIVIYSLAFSIFSNEGLLNRLLMPMGIQQSVLSDVNAVYWFQSVINQWKNIGWNAIIYIAAITGIDPELYEAAKADGAGRLRCSWHITVPGIMPTFIVLMFLNIAGFVNTGTDQHFAFKNAMVYDNIETFDLYTYRVGMQLSDYSLATAVGIFKSVISIVLLFAMNTLSKKVRGTSII
jgi:ABC-type polysaccharide transport system permease subunit